MVTQPPQHHPFRQVRRAKARRLAIVIAVVLAAVAAFPMLVQDPYLRNVAILVLLWTTAATGWNILGGYAGQFSFGHAAFFGTGAYTFILLFDRGVPWVLCLTAAALVATILGVSSGAVFFRLRGPYFALSMLALAEVVRLIAQNWTSLTGGAAGYLITAPFADAVRAWYLVAVVALVSILITRGVASSRLGYYLVALREDQEAASVLGIHPWLYKLKAMAISAAITGAAGGFYAGYFGYLEPNVVYSVVAISLPILLMVILGGYGTIAGPLIGAAVLTVMQETLRTYLGNANVLVFGLLIIVLVLYAPEGIVGLLTAARSGRRDRAVRRAEAVESSR